MYEIVGMIVVGMFVWEIVGFVLLWLYSIEQLRHDGCWTCFDYGGTTFEGDRLGRWFAGCMAYGQTLRASFVAPILVWPAFMTGWQRRRREARKYEALKHTLDAAGRNV